jgi:hypothetical protein
MHKLSVDVKAWNGADCKQAGIAGRRHVPLFIMALSSWLVNVVVCG